MAPSTTYKLADRACGGRLAVLLRDGKERGDSLRTIAGTLSDNGVDVSVQTVSNWLAALDAEEVAS